MGFPIALLYCGPAATAAAHVTSGCSPALWVLTHPLAGGVLGNAQREKKLKDKPLFVPLV